MKSHIPAPNTDTRWHPCPKCATSTAFQVVTELNTPDEVIQFVEQDLNRAVCPNCGRYFEAPVRLKVAEDEDLHPAMECIPIDLLQDPKILDEIIENTPEGLHRVYSHSELHRCIEASFRLKLRQEGVDPEDFESDRIW